MTDAGLDAMLFFWVILMVGGMILFIAVLSGAFSKVHYNTSTAPEHTYTEEEFIALFNYCIAKRNAKTNEPVSVHVNYQISNMDAVLDKCRTEYEQPYYEADLSELSKDLLTLLTPEEQRKINYGIIKVSEEET
jgi:type IV secretory pathway VirB6-like protein